MHKDAKAHRHKEKRDKVTKVQRDRAEKTRPLCPSKIEIHSRAHFVVLEIHYLELIAS
jgi:hypothetical protein